MDDQTAYDIVKAIYTNVDRLKAAHKACAVVSKATGKDGVSIKMAAGADKFFNEK